MPDRLLRNGLRHSESMSELSDGAFRFYVLLLTIHEDYGRFDARPKFLRTELFPFRIDRVRESDISRWIAECEKAGVIALYGSESKPFGVVLKSNTPRNKFPQAPEPPEGIECWRATPRGFVLGTEFVDEDGNKHLCANANKRKQTRPYSDSNSSSGSDSNSFPPNPRKRGSQGGRNSVSHEEVKALIAGPAKG